MSIAHLQFDYSSPHHSPPPFHPATKLTITGIFALCMVSCARAFSTTTETLIHSNSAFSLQTPKVAILLGGNVAMGWIEENSTPTSNNIVTTLRNSSNGIIANGTFPNPSNYENRNFHLVALDNGNWAPIWEEYDSTDSEILNYKSRIKYSNGADVTPTFQPQFDAASQCQKPYGAAIAGGFASLCIMDLQTGDGWNLFTRVVENSGTYRFDSRNTKLVGSGLVLSHARATKLSNGNILEVVKFTNTGSSQIAILVNSTTGLNIGTEITLPFVNCVAFDNIELAAQNGTFAIVGECSGGIWCRFFYNNLTALSQDFEITPFGTAPTLATVGPWLGVGYEKRGNDSDSSDGVAFAIINVSSTTTLLSELPLHTSIAGNQEKPHFSSLSNQLMAVWRRFGASLPDAVFAREIDVPSLFTPSSTPPPTLQPSFEPTPEPSPVPTAAPTQAGSPTLAPTTPAPGSTPLPSISPNGSSTTNSMGTSSPTPVSQTGPELNLTTGTESTAPPLTMAMNPAVDDRRENDGALVVTSVIVTLIGVGILLGVVYIWNKRQSNKRGVVNPLPPQETPQASGLESNNYAQLPFGEDSSPPLVGTSTFLGAAYGAITLRGKDEDGYSAITKTDSNYTTPPTALLHYDDSFPGGDEIAGGKKERKSRRSSKVHSRKSGTHQYEIAETPLQALHYDSPTSPLQPKSIPQQSQYDNFQKPSKAPQYDSTETTLNSHYDRAEAPLKA